MKKTYFYILILFFLSITDSNAQLDFNKIDSLVKNIQYEENKSLSEELTKNLNTDLEKVRAIFFWITNNIEYDIALSKDQKLINQLYTSEENVVKHTLKSKKAICSGYSFLFQKMCNDVNIEVVVINGFSRQMFDGFQEKKETDHAWNSVKINEKWFLLDLTWASGNTITGDFEKDFDDFWFLTEPNKFIYSHYPEDEKWTLLKNKFSKKDFYNLPTLNRNYFFTNATKIMLPTDGQIFIDSKNQFKITVKINTNETYVDISSTPWETYATINNLPEPTEEDYEREPDKYSLIVPSIELNHKERHGNLVTYVYDVKHKSLEKIWISIDDIQTAEYKIIWK